MIDKPREKALEILTQVEEGAFADGLLDQARRNFGPRDNAFILELVYGTLRQRAHLDWIINQFSAQPLSKTDTWTRNILRIGAYQMLFLDKVPVSAAVNTASELAKRHGKKPGYVNGLLRNLDRKRSSIAEPDLRDPVKKLSILYSHPEWLVGRWVKRFGAEKTEIFLRANNNPAPLVIRTNRLKTTREELEASLENDGAVVRKTKHSPAGLAIASSPGLHNLNAYQKGWFLVQDEAAQLIGSMLDPRPGESVLDACAAPGGKATHLAELMDNLGTVVALESEEARIGKINDNSERLGITIIKPVLGDATQYTEGLFDKILIDAPCSGLGVLRRHPDGRWTKKEASILGKQAVQLKILENCSRLLKPGGAMVYATCTTEPEENEVVIMAFLSKSGNTFMIDDPRPYLPEPARSLVKAQNFFKTFPLEPDMDGFFGVRLLKKL